MAQWADVALVIMNVETETILHRVKFGPGVVCCEFSPTGRHIVVGMASRGSFDLLSHNAVMAHVYRVPRYTKEIGTGLPLSRCIQLGTTGDLVYENGER